MKLTKKICLFAFGLSLFTSAYADDFDDFGDFGDSAGFGDSAAFGSSEEAKVDLGGLVEMNARTYVDHKAGERNKSENLEWDDIGGRALAVFPTGRINIGFSNTFSDVEMKLKFDKFSLSEGYYQDILDEFTARAYIGNLQLEAGKMKIVWGKGDKVHVLDNFNANDYTDYIIPDYIDRRIAEPMFRASYSTNNNVKFEAVYTPFMTADRLGNGFWTPKASAALTANVEAAVMEKLKTAITNKDTAKIAYSVLKGISADAQAASAALQTAQTTYDDVNSKVDGLNAIKAAASSMGAPEYAVYNSQTGANLASQEEFEALYTQATSGLNQAYVALVSATVASQTADKEYKAALKEAGFENLEACQAAVTASESAYTLALNNASAFSNNPDSIYPDLYQLKYGQFGFRTTFTLASVDLGLSYYNGHNKQPSVDARKIDSYLDKVLAGQNISDDDRFISYDRLQVFGLEAATVLFGRLNSRMEFAYNMTEDFAGDDPAVHNNSLAWVAGFDLDLPVHNINFNVQTQGKVVLNGDKINDSALKAIDVDADANDCYTNNKIIIDITDSWNHEKIKLDFKGIWGIERGDLLLMPGVTFMVKDDFALNLSGLLILCQDSESEFDGWQHNSFAQVGVKYQF